MVNQQFDAVRLPLEVEAYGMTDQGQVRSANEDQFVVASLRQVLHVDQTSIKQAPDLIESTQAHLFIVADGMGGQAGGKEASTLAVHAAEDFIVDTLRWCYDLNSTEGTVLDELRQLLELADAHLCEVAQQRPQLEGMGTTLTLGCSFKNTLFLAHAGDSRAYLFRDGELIQLTRDHTLVREMIRQGLMSPEAGQQHPLRNVVTNVLGGGEAGVTAEAHKLELAANDRLLFCSDGLTGMVNDDTIRDVLQTESHLQRMCKRLVDLANENGGRDNITVIAARYQGTESVH